MRVAYSRMSSEAMETDAFLTEEPHETKTETQGEDERVSQEERSWGRDGGRE